MSRAIKCDRCGKYYDENVKHTVKRQGDTVLSGMSTFTRNGFDYKSYDLCDECIDDLGDFLTGVQLVTKVTVKEG